MVQIRQCQFQYRLVIYRYELCLIERGGYLVVALPSQKVPTYLRGVGYSDSCMGYLGPLHMQERSLLTHRCEGKAGSS